MVENFLAVQVQHFIVAGTEASFLCTTSHMLRCSRFILV